MSKLAEVMATREGYGVPGAIPTVRNNPLDLRHGPNATHPADDPDGIGYYATPELGWADGERQLQIFAGRNLTVEEMIYTFVPPNANNNTAEYLAYICSGLKCDRQMLVSDALQIT